MPNLPIESWIALAGVIAPLIGQWWFSRPAEGKGLSYGFLSDANFLEIPAKVIKENRRHPDPDKLAWFDIEFPEHTLRLSRVLVRIRNDSDRAVESADVRVSASGPVVFFEPRTPILRKTGEDKSDSAKWTVFAVGPLNSREQVDLRFYVNGLAHNADVKVSSKSAGVSYKQIDEVGMSAIDRPVMGLKLKTWFNLVFWAAVIWWIVRNQPG